MADGATPPAPVPPGWSKVEVPAILPVPTAPIVLTSWQDHDEHYEFTVTCYISGDDKLLVNGSISKTATPEEMKSDVNALLDIARKEYALLTTGKENIVG